MLQAAPRTRPLATANKSQNRSCAKNIIRSFSSDASSTAPSSRSSKKLRVVVVGAGVGGLTVANAFHQKGHSVKVFERSPELLPFLGAGFGLTNGAILLRDALGINLEDISNPVKRMTAHELATGKVLGGMNFEKAVYEKQPAWKDGYKFVFRSQLVKRIAEYLPKDCLQLSHPFSHFEDKGADGVTVHFTNGTSYNADIVVGCDGIRSEVRKQLFGLPDPVYSGYCIWYGVSDMHRNPNVAGDVHFYYGKGEIVGHFPIGALESHKSVIFRMYKSDKVLEESWELKGAREEVLNAVKNHPAPIPAYFEHASLPHFGLYYHKPLTPAWHKGRVVLLGDSCHATLPTVGQGANMAIEDSLTLVKSVENSPENLERAFAEYYKERQPKTEEIVNLSKRLAGIEMASSPLGCFLRDKFLQVTLRSGMMESQLLAAVFKSSSNLSPKTGKVTF